MSGMLTVINVAGAVALLLWAVRMVRTGIDRAYGARFRRLLQTATSSRVRAIVVGTVLAIGLQGSTAVALLITPAVGGRLMTAVAGLSVLVGADLGSALVVGALSLDVAALVPVLLLAGVATFMLGQRRPVRQAARIIIGVALILLSLQLIGEAAAPLGESGLFRILTTYLAGDPLTAVVVAAAVTWVMHSSVAFVLLLSSLAALDLVDAPLALALVLGANIGSGLIAVVLTRNHEQRAWIVPLANLALRAVLALAGAGLLISGLLEGLIASGDTAAAIDVITFHVAFNVVVVLFGIPLAAPLMRSAAALLATVSSGESEEDDEHSRPPLDPEAVGQPPQALANALRETLRMSDIVSRMLDDVIKVFANGSKQRMSELAKLDDEVDRLYTAIKLYLARIPQERMSKSEARRRAQLITFCIKLEQAADVIVRGLLPLAGKRQSRDVSFSKHGWNELLDLHSRVSANLQLALNVLVSGDVESARELVEEKQNVRELEQSTTSRHMERLRQGTVRSIETSEIHLDAVRDLVQINTLFSAIAYAILEHRGELLDNRLVSSGS